MVESRQYQRESLKVIVKEITENKDKLLMAKPHCARVCQPKKAKSDGRKNTEEQIY